MPFSIKNPFEKAKKRKTDDAELVGELLGPEEEAEMREALGDQPVEEETTGDDSIRLSEEEEAEKKKVEEEVTSEQRRKEYVAWAMEIGKDEDWVDKTFTFKDDGSVEVEENLNLSDTNVTILPKGLKSIGGGVLLRDCTGLTSLEYLPPSIGGFLNLRGCTGLTSLEHLPPSFGGSLDLGNCTGLTSLEYMPSSIVGSLRLGGCIGLTSLDHLPLSIGGDLSLHHCNQIKDMPVGIKIRGDINLDKNQTELKANAEAKGYKVYTL